MSLHSTPSAERVHIGIFGKRNAGKSSLINAITSQDLAIVSEFKGTTTDPVFKAMELLPLGPVMIIDTPGIDDEGDLGQQRVQKAYQVLNKTDIAILVVDAIINISDEDLKLLKLIQEKNVKVIIAFNKCDLLTDEELHNLNAQVPHMAVSAATGENIYEFRKAIAELAPEEKKGHLLEDLIAPNDVVIMVTPIDESAPKGRIILPQQQVLRNVLDNKGIAIVVQPEELADTLKKLACKPRLVVTDSQVFPTVAKIVPEDVPLTSFSILMARYKGSLLNSVKSVKTLENIQDGDKILISEGCTHHRQCGDIGTEKLPSWIKNYTNKNINFDFTSGGDFPEDLGKYKLIIHCGACMLTEREMKSRIALSTEQQISLSNYGIVIAKINGILERAIKPLR